jgi:hypothetical protein
VTTKIFALVQRQVVLLAPLKLNSAAQPNELSAVGITVSPRFVLESNDTNREVPSLE